MAVREQMIESDEWHPNEYENPPVVEVVLATRFEAISRLGVIALGDLWRAAFSDLDSVSENPPLEMPVEQFGQPRMPGLSLEMIGTPPPPRLWFQDQDGTQLVQVQNNFLARNWRRAESGTDYPRYEVLRDRFANDLDNLEAFLGREDLGRLIPTQAEITYVNHIRVARVSDAIRTARDATELGLPSEEAADFSSQFIVGDQESPLGRMYVKAATAVTKASSERIVALNLTVRGAPISPGTAGVLEFLDIGRRWAQTTFDALTRPELQLAWGKQE